MNLSIPPSTPRINSLVSEIGKAAGCASLTWGVGQVLEKKRTVTRLKETKMILDRNDQRIKGRTQAQEAAINKSKRMQGIMQALNQKKIDENQANLLLTDLSNNFKNINSSENNHQQNEISPPFASVFFSKSKSTKKEDSFIKEFAGPELQDFNKIENSKNNFFFDFILLFIIWYFILNLIKNREQILRKFFLPK